MPKRIREHMELYIAPSIKGIKNDNGINLWDKDNNQYNPNCIDDKIKIYKNQVEGWFLNHAETLLNSGNNGSFTAFMIAISYIEGVQQYKEGRSSNGRSKTTFKKGFKNIFGRRYSTSDINRLYTEARCGLFHNGMTGGDIILKSDWGCAIEFLNEDIIINPRLFVDEIKKDFQSYLYDLSNLQNVELRRKFDNMFSVI